MTSLRRNHRISGPPLVMRNRTASPSMASATHSLTRKVVRHPPAARASTIRRGAPSAPWFNTTRADRSAQPITPSRATRQAGASAGGAVSDGVAGAIAPTAAPAASCVAPPLGSAGTRAAVRGTITRGGAGGGSGSCGGSSTVGSAAQARSRQRAARDIANRSIVAIIARDPVIGAAIMGLAGLVTFACVASLRVFIDSGS